MSEFEGEIEEANTELKQMKYPNKDGSISWKYGLKVKGEWYGIFGSEEELADIQNDVLCGGNYAKGTYKLSKDGKYRNIEEVKISRTMKNPEEATDPAKSLSGTKQGKAEPRKELPVQEELIGVEEVEALVDRHYIAMMHRARRIINQAEQVKPCPWLDGEEKRAFLAAIFDKLAGPEVYVRADVEKYLMTKRVK